MKTTTIKKNKPDLSQLTEAELMPLAYHNIDMQTLTEICNPFEGCWMELTEPITKEEVLDCIKKGKAQLVDTPIWTDIAFGKIKLTEAKIRQNHIQKIAYFAINEIENPISIDVGIPDLGCFVSYLIDDGNHRLAGAIIKGDTTIKAHVSGAASHAKELGLHNPNEYEIMLEKKYIEDYENRSKATKKTSKLTIPKAPKPSKVKF